MDSKFLATIGLQRGSPNRLKTGLPSHSELPHKTEALLGLAPLTVAHPVKPLLPMANPQPVNNFTRRNGPAGHYLPSRGAEQAVPLSCRGEDVS